MSWQLVFRWEAKSESRYDCNLNRSMIDIYRQRVGGCSQVVKIAQQEYGISRCEISPARFTLANQSSCKITSLISAENLPSKRTCYLCLPPSKSARDGGGGPVRRHSHLELAGLVDMNLFPSSLLFLENPYWGLYSIMLQNDQSEPIIPDPKASIQHVAIDPKGHHMAAVNNKVSKSSAEDGFLTCMRHILWRAIAMYGLFRVGNLKSLASYCQRTKSWHTRAGEEDLQFKHRRAILDKTCAVQTAIQTFVLRYSLCCQFSPDSSLLVTTSADHTAKLWRTSDFTLVQVVIHLFQWSKPQNPRFSKQVSILQELTCPDQRWVWDAAFTADSQ